MKYDEQTKMALDELVAAGTFDAQDLKDGIDTDLIWRHYKWRYYSFEDHEADEPITYPKKREIRDLE